MLWPVKDDRKPFYSIGSQGFYEDANSLGDCSFDEGLYGHDLLNFSYHSRLFEGKVN